MQALHCTYRISMILSIVYTVLPPMPAKKVVFLVVVVKFKKLIVQFFLFENNEVKVRKRLDVATLCMHAKNIINYNYTI